jgi:hypothetical protein
MRFLIDESVDVLRAHAAELHEFIVVDDRRIRIRGR